MGTLANSEDPGEMQHDAAFHQDLHCLLRLNEPKGTEIHILENFTYNLLKYTMRSPLLLVLISIGKSIRIQRVNNFLTSHNTLVVG